MPQYSEQTNQMTDEQRTDNRQKTEYRQKDAQISDNFSFCQSDSLPSDSLNV